MHGRLRTPDEIQNPSKAPRGGPGTPAATTGARYGRFLRHRVTADATAATAGHPLHPAGVCRNAASALLPTLSAPYLARAPARQGQSHQRYDGKVVHPPRRLALRVDPVAHVIPTARVCVFNAAGYSPRSSCASEVATVEN